MQTRENVAMGTGKIRISRRLRGLGAIGACSAVVLASGVLADASAASADPPLIVGNGTSPAACLNTATYSTISSAVAAANPGDTIEVCAGTYLETVDVNTPNLTFEGAQNGIDPVKTTPKGKTQSKVISNNGGFILSSSADDTVIDGFTIEKAGTENSTNDDGVEAFQGSSGLTLEDNIISANNNGINLQNPNGAEPAVIEDNVFANNSDGGNYQTNPQTGTAIFISNGPADNTLITKNTFSGDSQTAINFAGSGSNYSTGLVVSHNKSTNDSTFVVATNSTNALIENNKISTGPLAPGGPGDALLDFGSNVGLQILNNKISATGATGSQAGVLVADFSGPPSANTTISSNTITGFPDGINLYQSSSADLLSNTIKNSGTAGINSSSSSSGNVISHNTLSGSPAPAVDCQDASTGSGTDGTANTWTSDHGSDNDSSPAGICP